MKQAGWVLTAIFVLAFGLRLGVCVARGTLGQPRTGYREYVISGQRLVQHGVIVSPLILEDVDHTPSAMMPPAYVALVAAMYKLLGIESAAATLALHLLNALAGALTAAVAYLVARRLAGDRAAFLAGAITAINPTLPGYTDMIWDTSLFGLGVALTAWMAVGLKSARSRLGKAGGWWLAFGLWLGALALLNPALTIAYPFFVLWAIGRGLPWRTVMGRVGLVLVGWLIAIGPWTIRNYTAFHELIYVRNGFAIQLWLGSCPEADPGGADAFKTHFPLLNDEVQAHVRQVGERAYIRECKELASAAIREDPWRFVRLCLIRAADFWAGTTFSHPEPQPGKRLTPRLRDITMFFLLAEAIVIVLCIILRRSIHADARWLLAALLVFSFVYGITHVQLRFRAPIEPLMAVILAVLTFESGRRDRACLSESHAQGMARS